MRRSRSVEATSGPGGGPVDASAPVAGVTPVTGNASVGREATGAPASNGTLGVRGTYANPQNVGTDGQRLPGVPRRAGQGQLYRRYVPAQGEEPPHLRKDYGEGWMAMPVDLGADDSQSPSRRRLVIVVASVAMAAAVLVGGGLAVHAVLNPNDSAGASTGGITNEVPSFDEGADTALGFLTSNASATEEDMDVLNLLFPSMLEEYETVREEIPSAVEPHDVIRKVSMSGWKDNISGWDDIQLRVRASEYALEELRRQYGGNYTVEEAEVTGGEEPESVRVRCRCTEGANEGILVNATVGLAGKAPMVVADVDSAVSYKNGVLDRLSAVLQRRPDLYIGDFALEGYTTPLKKEDGTMMRTETWWLYVNSNVAPQDIDEFVRFVNDMHAAFVQTAGSDVVNVDLTVISCDATDPAMGGKGFAELAAELATSNDPGGRYMEFDYVLRGQASTTTPCREEDLDGRLHPYSWDGSSQA